MSANPVHNPGLNRYGQTCVNFREYPLCNNADNVTSEMREAFHAEGTSDTGHGDMGHHGYGC